MASGWEWPDPMPGYTGIFTYQVDHTQTGQEQLGQGVFLWRLEILPKTFEQLGGGKVRCHMRKSLVSLPADACDALQDTRGRYVVEEWSGTAAAEERAIRLESIGAAPVDKTIDFDDPRGLPLTREILAGEYQMILADDGSVFTAVHSSWVEFAKLDPSDATGILFRMDLGSEVSIVAPIPKSCMLLPCCLRLRLLSHLRYRCHRSCARW